MPGRLLRWTIARGAAMFTRPPHPARVGRADRRLASDISESVDMDMLKRGVELLAFPRSRLHARGAMSAVESHLVESFQDCGFAVHRQELGLTNVVGHRDYGMFERHTYNQLDGVNVVGVRPGQARKAHEARKAVVVLAHYDTVRDSPGADDNTASIVALLELARILGSTNPKRLRHSVVLAATDLEEPGILGAGELVRQLASHHEIIAAINLECIAYTNPAPHSQWLPDGLELLYPAQIRWLDRQNFAGDFTAVIYNRPARTAATIFAGALNHACDATSTAMLLREPSGLPIIGGWVQRRAAAARHFRRSDHAPFWDAGLPAIQVTDTAEFRYPHYHLSSDTFDQLNYRRLRDIIVATAVTVLRMAGSR